MVLFQFQYTKQQFFLILGLGKAEGITTNPTRAYLEEIISNLEGAVDTVACSSGMAAISLVLELFSSGDHLICSNDLYGGSTRLFTLQQNKGLKFSYVDTTNLKSFKQYIRPQTKAVFIETPSNPTMQISDLKKISALCQAHKLLLIVDNTFLSPYFQNPLLLGADIVIHSATKFLSGHNDIIAGSISTGDHKLAKRIREVSKTVGNSLSPLDCYLLIRGIKTLAIRQKSQQENALKISNWLNRHPRVSKVYYPGLIEHPGYEINRNQARGFGSMIAFSVENHFLAKKILENVQLITYAESLGGVESLITYPMIQTHGDVPAEIRAKLGITDNFLRLSVGIENIDDLLADLRQAFGDNDEI